MWKHTYPRSWGKLFERYIDEFLPDKKEEICSRADTEYAKLLAQKPDIGRGAMADTMDIWFCIVAFYEASGHVIDGEAFQVIHGWHIDRLRFLGRFINANRHKLPYRLMSGVYERYDKELREHRAKGEWVDAWDIAIDPDNRQEGYSFHLIGCPIAKHAKANGYTHLLPYLCKTDHVLAEVLHARLIRTKTEILGGDCCDYWYVGDESAAAKEFADLEKI
ncbi:MAG: L-2-amino-thiazoline-4-carboxylic acid hydrolase [Ruminococcus sp.]|nr:L-2-amino-thiazoline-4-carboxylic acid hydrolase [Ruminococcus sp.]